MSGDFKITSEATEALASSLYETMEELETDESAGPPWDELPESYKPWYRRCATAFLERAKPRSKPAVTPEMLSAGIEVLIDLNSPDHPTGRLCERIFDAMWEASRQPAP